MPSCSTWTSRQTRRASIGISIIQPANRKARIPSRAPYPSTTSAWPGWPYSWWVYQLAKQLFVKQITMTTLTQTPTQTEAETELTLPFCSADPQNRLVLVPTPHLPFVMTRAWLTVTKLHVNLLLSCCQMRWQLPLLASFSLKQQQQQQQQPEQMPICIGQQIHWQHKVQHTQTVARRHIAVHVAYAQRGLSQPNEGWRCPSQCWPCRHSEPNSVIDWFYHFAN